MTPEQAARLEAMSMKRRVITFRDKERSTYRRIGEVVDEVSVMVGDYKHMIQRVRFLPGIRWGGSTYGYRAGYYTYDGAGKWIK